MFHWKQHCFEIAFPEDLVNKINIKHTSVASIYLPHNLYSYKHIDALYFIVWIKNANLRFKTVEKSIW